jgi:hypothetical protein
MQAKSQKNVMPFTALHLQEKATMKHPRRLCIFFAKKFAKTIVFSKK